VGRAVGQAGNRPQPRGLPSSMADDPSATAAARQSLPPRGSRSLCGLLPKSGHTTDCCDHITKNSAYNLAFLPTRRLTDNQFPTLFVKFTPMFAGRWRAETAPRGRSGWVPSESTTARGAALGPPPNRALTVQTFGQNPESLRSRRCDPAAKKISIWGFER
jgi:hypothetical protein